MKLSPTFDPLSLLLALSGTYPIHETRQRSWWRQIHKIGFLFCLVQLWLTFMGFRKESRRSGAVEHFANNIMRLSVLNKQFFTLLVPVVYILTMFLHIRSLQRFHSRTADSDDLVRSDTWTQQMNYGRSVVRIQEISTRNSNIAVLLLLVGVLLNMWIGFVYTRETTGTAPEALSLYFYQVALLNFVGTALHIGIRFKGIGMRLQLLLDMQRRILRDITRMELERMRTGNVFER